MKKYIVMFGLTLVMGLFMANNAVAQHSLWGDNPTYTNFNLGLGLDNPTGSLHILRTSPGQFAIQERVESHPGGAALVMRKARGTVAAKTMPLDNDVIGGLFGQVWANNGWRPAATIRFFADGDVTNSSASGKISFQVQDGSIIPGGLKDAMVIRHTGAVGIGTEEIPEGFLFAVNGKVIAEELQVQLKGDWPDFVFADDYELMSLYEVENYIKQNRHLPNVPSEAQVLENGVNVGEMTSILLQKVEELTLHIIELNKRIEELEK